MHLNLHEKFLLSVIALVIISLSSMGIVLFRDAERKVEEFKILQAKSQARTLAESIVEPLLVKDYPLIENLVNVAISEESYAYAAIVLPDGVVVSHSNLDLVGRRISTSPDKTRIAMRGLISEGHRIKEIIHPISFNGKHLASAHIAYYLDSEFLASDSVKWLVQILLLALVVMSLGSILITRRLTQPIVNLTTAVKQNPTDSRLVIDKVILAQDDEVGDLANAFQSMSDQLVDRLDELKVQIKERDSARAANETKSAFLANVSHELRTPLNAIIGYSELLLEVAEDEDQENKSDLEKIRQSGKHLTSLINDMLDLSKIEAGKMVVVPEYINVWQLIEDVVATVQPLIDKNNNELVSHCAFVDEFVYADPLRLKQVIFNLLSNAAKFTNNGKIDIDINSCGDMVELLVTDSGIGMTGEQLARVFDAFAQAESSTTSKYGGTGLGLTISRRLCQMMGGDIFVSSQPGAGSTFSILIPSAEPMKNTSERHSRSNYFKEAKANKTA